MDPNRLTLAHHEFNAHVLRGVMDATGQPGETAQDAQTRCAAIVEIFRTFEAANPIEAMIACHCILLRFMFEAAMRDANAADQEPAMLIRLRASAMAAGKSLDLWMRNFASLHARNEARAVEAQRTGQPAGVATEAKPQPTPTPVQPRPAQSAQPPAVAGQPVEPASPLVASLANRVQSALGLADLPAQSMKRALLSSATVSPGAASNGRLTATTPMPGS
jgi:hypothetical protein